MFEEYPQAIEPIVPGRGPLASLRDLRDYHDMLIAVRERIEQLVRTGKTIEEAVASHPTRGFDGRWGHGLVAPDRFVAMVYESLAKELALKGGPRD